MMPKRLSGRTILVVGGAHGMGAAQARLFATEGAFVVIGDVLGDDAHELANDIGDAAVGCQLDVRSAEAWDAALELGSAASGRPVAGMVNNAGISVTRMIEDSSLEDYASVVEVNQIGTFLGIRACIPVMRQGGGGSIVAISSILGLGAMVASSGYVSSKFAIRGLVRAAALELARSGIRVNAICPGLVDTQMVRAGDDSPDALVPLGRRVPMGMVGEPSMIADAASFLLSDESRYITGIDLTVDGGSSARIPLNMKK